MERLAQTSIKYIIFSESLGIANYEGILGKIQHFSVFGKYDKLSQSLEVH